MEKVCAHCGEPMFRRPRAQVFHKGKPDEKILCIPCDKNGVKLNAITGRLQTPWEIEPDFLEEIKRFQPDVAALIDSDPPPPIKKWRPD